MLFLIVIQLVLPLHESVVKPLNATSDPLHAATEAIADPAAAESAPEPLHVVVACAARTGTSCLCVCVSTLGIT
jgi:hypothetical protein